MKKLDLEEIARAFGVAIYNCYGAVLVGNPAPVTGTMYDRMKDMRIGDWVVEQTTICMAGQNGHFRSALDAVGKLVKITQEKVDFQDPDFVWDEAAEGRPHPTEQCVYIQTIDGREFRWTNASFISVPVEFPIRPLQPL